MTRSATRSTTSGRRTCAASPTLTQLTPHVARGNQECSVTAGALIARRSPFRGRRNRPQSSQISRIGVVLIQ